MKVPWRKAMGRGDAMLTPPKDYDADLFIDRPNSLNEILQWAGSGSEEDRVLTVIASPGRGKSWLLQAFLEKWNAASRNCPILMVNGPEFIHRQEDGWALDDDRVRKWLKDAFRAFNRRCKDVGTFNPLLDFSRSIEQLARTLCEKCCEAVVLVVDGYDEIEREGRALLEERILEPFLSRQCTRILLAYRTECNLEGYLLRSCQKELFLEQMDPPFSAVSQFARLLSWNHLNMPKSWWSQCQGWMSGLGNYQWDHPFISAHLFVSAFDPTQHTLAGFTRMGVRDCLDEVVQRGGRYPALSHPDLKTLVGIAGLPDQWTIHQLEACFGNPGHDTIDPFMEQGLIEYLNATQRYEIVNGIRELLRDYNQLP